MLIGSGGLGGCSLLAARISEVTKRFAIVEGGSGCAALYVRVRS